MKKLLIVALMALGLAACSDSGKLNAEALQAKKAQPIMTIRGRYTLTPQSEQAGATPGTLEAMVWVPKPPGSAIKGLVKEVQKVAIVDGQFELSFPVTEILTGGVVVSADGGKLTVAKQSIVLEPGSISVDMNAETMVGGPLYEQVYGVWKNDPEYKRLVAERLALYGKYNDTLPESELQAISNEIGQLGSTMGAMAEKHLMSVIDNAPNPVARFLALTVYENGLDASQRLQYMQALKAEMPNSLALEHEIVRLKDRVAAAEIKDSIKVGSIIKDFEAQDLQGNNFKVSEVMNNNKYVLVEFWASWCAPCRAEIPHMKQAYKHFNSKGFEIVSFSLDHEQESWEEASEEDGIPWVDVSDLEAYDSPVVKLYGVNGIPANYLVEAATGKIVGINLRKEKLDNKLAELFD
ncbi:redoxin domain-containing protein [Porticoccus sp. W117]|uniref:peroxiredoxin family protein n=1 Tax=Porticoccus sp. W117 TaxID=3054777 RepID=UPI002594B5C9|nr:redoxin domain-containing protein [Porticoccus sp. W117]MDM3871432.1 redoxin domain-containing protein [Porticoccus sp. W117]